MGSGSNAVFLRPWQKLPWDAAQSPGCCCRLPEPLQLRRITAEAFVTRFGRGVQLHHELSHGLRRSCRRRRMHAKRRRWLAGCPPKRASRSAIPSWRSQHSPLAGASGAIKTVQCSRQQAPWPAHSCSHGRGGAVVNLQPVLTTGNGWNQSPSRTHACRAAAAAASRSMPWGLRRRTPRSAWRRFCRQKCRSNSNSLWSRSSRLAASLHLHRYSPHNRPLPWDRAGAPPAQRSGLRVSATVTSRGAAPADPSAAACSRLAAGRLRRGSLRPTPQLLLRRSLRCTPRSAASAAPSAP